MDVSHSRDLTLIIEVLRRGVALGLFVAAATLGFGYGRADLAGLGAVAATLVYWLPPRPRIPEGAIHHERMPTVIMPDLLGFMLATVFIALPLIVSAQEPWLGGPWGIYLLTGLPALIALVIFWVSIRHQCFWLRPNGPDLTIADLRGVENVPYRQIAKVRGETRPAPRWLAPLLVLFGGWRGLGIALLTGQRPSHALILELVDGTTRKIPADALPEQKPLLALLARHDVKLDPGLTAFVGKAGGRHRPARKPVARRHKTTKRT